MRSSFGLFKFLFQRALIGSDVLTDPMGREPGDPTDVTGEMTLMRESAGGGDFGHGQAIPCEQRACTFDSTLNDVLMDRNAHGLPEESLEMRRTEAGRGSDLLEREILSDSVFDKGENLLESAAGELRAWHGLRLGKRAMLRNQPGGHRDDQSFGIETTGRAAGFDFAMEGIGDQLQLRVANLESITNLDAPRIVTSVLHHGMNQRLRQGEKKITVVPIVSDPIAWSVSRDDVDVALNSGASVLLAVAVAGEQCRRAHMDTQHGVFDARKADRADRILSQLKDHVMSRRCLREDLRDFQGKRLEAGWRVRGHRDVLQN